MREEEDESGPETGCLGPHLEGLASFPAAQLIHAVSEYLDRLSTEKATHAISCSIKQGLSRL